MKKTFRVCTLAVVASGAVLATAGSAQAANQDCTTLPHPVYIAGSSAAKPYLISIAKALGSNISIIYQAPASCNGLLDVTAPQTEASSALYLKSDGTTATCTAGSNPYPAINVDIGVADVFPSTCIAPAVTLSATQKEFQGAIQPMEIVVPWSSSENSISADAAYVVFGWAGSSGNPTVMPWNDPTAVWTRGDTSGTQLMTATAIGLAGNKWLSGLSAEAGAAQILGGSGAMATAIQNGGATKAAQTIGILSAGTADPLRGAPGMTDAGATTLGIKPLAFQATASSPAQMCGYYPDSDLNHFDKLNVRQGRYDIWGPIHFVSNVDGSGNPVASPNASSNPDVEADADVATVINIITHKGLTASSTPTLQDVIGYETAAHFVPNCAMEVSRSSEIGGEASYAPTGACGCYFESLVGGGTTTSPYCQTCTGDADCADAGVYSHCNYGYCEAQ